MDWNNIDLSDAYERNLPILDSYDFDTLLLEINCNVREINEQTVRAQFRESINSKIESAKEVFEANIKNITKEAVRYRAIP